MTQFLASVCTADEARQAVEGGADIIDLKNPKTGSLGALPLEEIREITRQIGEQCPVSATVGDLPPDPQRLYQAVCDTSETGVKYIKVGFFSRKNLSPCLEILAALTAQQEIIAVLFADRDPPVDRLFELVEAGFSGVMLDTADKKNGHLTNHITLEMLKHFNEKAHSMGLLSGMAGSLRLEDISTLLPLQPDYLGFRGSLCTGYNRTHTLDPAKLSRIRAAIPQAGKPAHFF